MKKQLFFTLLTMMCSCLCVSAQDWALKENNNWKFYQYGGLSFVNNVPVVDSSAMRWSYSLPDTTVQTYGAAAVSDENGNLLFYSDAYNVWNRNHQIMPNGNGLISGNALDAVLILPVLGNHNQYYLFYMAGTIDFFSASANAYQLMYSVIDMSLDNGLGDVVPTQKDIVVAANLSGAMKAVPGDDCNIWLLTHDGYSAQFKAFEITDDGLNTTPVNSNVGNGDVGFMGALSFGGNIAVSHDRSRIAFAQNGGDLVPILELFDFDPSTAAVSNASVIDTLQFIFGYSMCFSPGNANLYLSMLNPGEMYPDNPNNLHVESSLFQYNLNAGSNTAIQNSRLLLTDSISSYNNMMRMGPDGKIYLPDSYGGDTSTTIGASYLDPSYQAPGDYSGPPFQAYIGCIQNPDVTGTGCNLNRKAIALPAYSSAAETMGGIYVKPIPGDSVFAVHDTVFCNTPADQMVLQSPFDGFYQEWDDGSTSPQRTITTSGTYWVRNGDYCHYRVDTFIVDVETVSPVLTVSGHTLGTTVPFLHYQWLLNNNIIPGATGSTYTMTENGDYAVIAGNDNCTDTSDVYTATDVTGVHNINGLGRYIRVYPNPASDLINIDAPLPVDVTINSMEGRTLGIYKNARSISVRSLSAGIYVLLIYDREGALLKAEKVLRQ